MEDCSTQLLSHPVMEERIASFHSLMALLASPLIPQVRLLKSAEVWGMGWAPQLLSLLLWPPSILLTQGISAVLWEAVYQAALAAVSTAAEVPWLQLRSSWALYSLHTVWVPPARLPCHTLAPNPTHHAGQHACAGHRAKAMQGSGVLLESPAGIPAARSGAGAAAAWQACTAGASTATAMAQACLSIGCTEVGCWACAQSESPSSGALLLSELGPYVSRQPKHADLDVATLPVPFCIPKSLPLSTECCSWIDNQIEKSLWGLRFWQGLRDTLLLWWLALVILWAGAAGAVASHAWLLPL